MPDIEHTEQRERFLPAKKRLMMVYQKDRPFSLVARYSLLLMHHR